MYGLIWSVLSTNISIYNNVAGNCFRPPTCIVICIIQYSWILTLPEKLKHFFHLAKPKGRPKNLLKCSKHVNNTVLSKQLDTIYNKTIWKYFVPQISCMASIQVLGTSCSNVGNFESCISTSGLCNGSIGKLKWIWDEPEAKWTSFCWKVVPVSYTHLTLPTNREV